MAAYSVAIVPFTMEGGKPRTRENAPKVLAKVFEQDFAVAPAAAVDDACTRLGVQPQGTLQQGVLRQIGQLTESRYVVSGRYRFRSDRDLGWGGFKCEGMVWMDMQVLDAETGQVVFMHADPDAVPCSKAACGRGKEKVIIALVTHLAGIFFPWNDKGKAEGQALVRGTAIVYDQFMAARRQAAAMAPQPETRPAANVIAATSTHAPVLYVGNKMVGPPTQPSVPAPVPPPDPALPAQVETILLPGSCSGADQLVPLRAVCDWLGGVSLRTTYPGGRLMVEIRRGGTRLAVSDRDCNIIVVPGGVRGLPVPPEMRGEAMFVHPSLFEYLGCGVAVDPVQRVVTLSEGQRTGCLRMP
jgi:hypothetical protein